MSLDILCNPVQDAASVHIDRAQPRTVAYGELEPDALRSLRMHYRKELRTRRQTIAIGVLSMVVLLLAFSLHVKLTFRVEVTPFAQALKQIQYAIPVGKIDELYRTVTAGEVQWRKVDRGSAGSPKKEARLMQLHDGMYYFSLTFGHPPASIGEMSRFLTTPQVSQDQNDLYTGLIRDCQILNLRSDSYILNCDGWVSPSPSEFQQLAKVFDSETEKFYSVQDHV
ncbi:MAG: hypothetical protein WCA34_03485, partial [Candidatus Acidiferrales bacterium]